MDKKDFFYFGKVVKKFGYKGELVIHADVDEAEKYAGLEFLFVEINERLIPFFIENLSLKTADTFLVKFEDIDNPDNTKRIMNSDLYLPVTFLSKLPDSRFYLHEIIGFDVIEKKEGNLGKIHSIIDQTEQPLIQILKGKTEILIPLTDEFILETDKKKKQIIIEIPEGLINLKK